MRFSTDLRGAVALTVAISLGPMVALTGLAIDLGHVQAVREAVQSAMDSAALAAARDIATLDHARVVEKARSYYRANVPAKYLGYDIPAPAVRVDASRGSVELTAALPLDIFGHAVPVTLNSEVVNEGSNLEIALALDASSSMWGTLSNRQRRVDALNNAVALFLDAVYGTRDEREGVRVSVVPYSSTVNIGRTLHNRWAQQPAATYKGCVELREINGRPDQTDTPPETARLKFPTYQVPDTCNVATIAPLTTKRADIENTVYGMRPHGSTVHPAGVLWAWNTLSPRWRGYWPGLDTDFPRPYRDAKNQKILVLMTDGSPCYGASQGDTANCTRTPAAEDVYGPYGWLKAEQRLGTAELPTANRRLQDETLAICRAMRDAGITIYSVVLRDTGGNGLEEQLHGCATDRSKAFSAANADDLADAFREIGESLARLRIVR